MRTILAILFLSVVQVGCGHSSYAYVTRQDGQTPKEIFIHDVTVFDGRTRLAHQDVVIEGCRIRSVGPTSGIRPADEGRRIISGRGRTLLPGLVDMHVHLRSLPGPLWKPRVLDPKTAARALLYGGVTTAFVPGDRESWEPRSDLPRLYFAGLGLTGPGAHPLPFATAVTPWWLDLYLVLTTPQVKTAPEAERAITVHADEKSHTRFVKLYYEAFPRSDPSGKPGPELPREALEAAVKLARAKGLRPVVHATDIEHLLFAAGLGIDLLMHPPGGTLSPEQVGAIRESGVPFVTTSRILGAHEELAEEWPTRLESEIVPSSVLNAFPERPRAWTIPGFEEEELRFPSYVQEGQANIKRLVDGGVPFFVGTDTGVSGIFPGASIHRELQVLAKLGIEPIRILRAATYEPACFLEKSSDPSFGLIASGKRADLVLVRGDPTLDIGATEDIVAVLRDGVLLDRHRTW